MAPRPRLLATAVAVVAAAAQGGPREDFAAAVSGQQALEARELDSLNAIFLRELKELEEQALAAGDYLTAIRCRDRRRQLSGFIDRPATGVKPVPGNGRSWRLEAAAARDLAGLQLRGDALVIDGEGASPADPEGGEPDGGDEETTGPRAEWVLPGIPPGGYRVRVVIEGLGEGAVVRVAEDYFHVEGGGNSGDEGVDCGNLKVTRGGGPLRLILRNLNDGDQPRVRAVELVSNAPEGDE